MVKYFSPASGLFLAITAAVYTNEYTPAAVITVPPAAKPLPTEAASGPTAAVPTTFPAELPTATICGAMGRRAFGSSPA